MDKIEIIRRSQLIAGTGSRLDYAEQLYNMALKLPDNCKILEIGAMMGGSAATMALTVKDRGGMVYSIDPSFSVFDRKKEYDPKELLGDLHGYLDTMRITEAEGYCIPLAGTSEEVLNRWHIKEPKILFDLVFIDGWHTYEGVKIDMQWLQYTKAQAYCMFDDWMEGIKKACEEYMAFHPEWKEISDKPHTYKKG